MSTFRPDKAGIKLRDGTSIAVAPGINVSGAQTGRFPARPQLPEMTEESAAKFREKLIGLGLLVPTKTVYREWQRPPLEGHALMRYKHALIQQGLLIPEEFTNGV